MRHERPILRTAETLLPLPRQERSIEKRRRLLDAARRLFAGEGWEATAIDDITAAAGVASGAFYQHFASKRQLLVALMNELLERLAAIDLRVERGDDLRASLHDFLTRLFRTDLAYWGVIRAWQEAAPGDAELRAMQADVERWTHARIVALFTQLLPARCRRRADLDVFARMMDRHFWALLARGASLSARELERELAVAAEVIALFLECVTMPRQEERMAKGNNSRKKETKKPKKDAKTAAAPGGKKK